jgi:hypothetical protein
MKIRGYKLSSKRYHKPAIAAVALGALMSFQGGAARADDTATEIRLLKARLKQLEERVAEQGRKEKETQAQIRHAAAQPGPPPGPAPYAYPIGIGVPEQPPIGNALAERLAKIKGYPYVGATSLYLGGMTITPGGFLELGSVTRDHFIGADMATPFGNIPFANNPSSHTDEFRFSARRSRLSFLTLGDVDPATHLAGFGEFDFLGAAQTANSNESNSFNPRVRQLYMTVDQDDFGAHLLAGQAWTLATMNLVGIVPRTENTPLVIDDQYLPGFTWARQPQIRVTKDFDNTFWVALSAENPQTTFGSTTSSNGVFPTVPTVTFNQIPPGGSLFNSANAISLNQFPDIIGKAAWDPTIADRTIHMEVFGIFRDFHDRVDFPAGTAFVGQTDEVAGGGVGGSILVPIVPKVLDVQFSGMTGRGIGRYGASQLPDVTFNANGSLSPIRETMLLTGAIWHALPGLNFYAYAGGEKENPSFGFTPLGANHFVGFANPFFNNAGCEIENSAAALCSNNIKLVRQFTGGFWDDIYKGPYGRLAGGLQYSFTQKYGFNGIGVPGNGITGIPGTGSSPKVSENIFFTSLRYYPF